MTSEIEKENLKENDVNASSKLPFEEVFAEKAEIVEQESENSSHKTNNFASSKENSEDFSSIELKNSSDPVSVNSSYFDTSSAQKIASEENDNLIFSKLFPGVSREDVEKDEDFKLFARTKAKNVLFSSLYCDYLALVERISASATEKALFSLQNSNATPGSLASASQGDGFYTKEQVLKMSREEISNNYEKIRQSQQSW